MLRYYDEVGLLKPAEVDPWTGHRLYSVEQIPHLNKILYLRDSGLNVSEIALALTMDNQSLLKQLDKKSLEIACAIQAEQEKLKRIELAKREIQGGKGEDHYHIFVKSIPAYQVLSLRSVVPTYYSEGDLWNEVSAFIKGGYLAFAEWLQKNAGRFSFSSCISHDVRFYTGFINKSEVKYERSSKSHWQSKA